jgi:hypothetical protein
LTVYDAGSDEINAFKASWLFKMAYSKRSELKCAGRITTEQGC